jgi:uncharacterized coiled-coil protein SlyX
MRRLILALALCLPLAAQDKTDQVIQELRNQIKEVELMVARMQVSLIQLEKLAAEKKGVKPAEARSLPAGEWTTSPYYACRNDSGEWVPCPKSDVRK